MVIRLHKRARTTPAVREEIRNSSLGVRTLAREYGLNRATVRKWKQRDSAQDRSHRPHELHATLTPAQDAVVLAIRETLELPLDDLLAVVREFICADLSRSALARMLKRHGVPSIRELRAQRQAKDTPAPKGFKPYEPGYLHVDVKYLPVMPDETRRRYLFVAIDRATRWVYVEVLASKSAAAAAGFFKRLLQAAPMKIHTVLTDNGKEFTDRFCATGERDPTGRHKVDQVCTAAGIEHRLIPPRRPQTNGMVERFNGGIGEVLATHRYRSGEDLKSALERYARLYNHALPQAVLGHRPPIEALKEWQQQRPDLFQKKVYHVTGLGT